ncbi:hypothetical protein [Nocardioides sp.]|uniref:hypothetical protein n=1 Tax=Nocardioides sp. TaxID=35761 RepID=UPI0035148CC4
MSSSLPSAPAAPAAPVASTPRAAWSLWPLVVAPAVAVATMVALEKIYPLLELGPAGDDSLYALVYLAYAIVLAPLLLVSIALAVGSLVRRRPLSTWASSGVTVLYAAGTTWLVGSGFANDPQTYTPASIAIYESALTWVLIAELAAFTLLLAAPLVARLKNR